MDNNNIFSGLENLGFDKATALDLYNKKKDTSDEISITEEVSEEDKQRNLLYDKEIVCPVCDHPFKYRALKKSHNRLIKRDTDFFETYSLINPYFYDVIICNVCGYSSLKADFEKIKSYQIENIQKKITPNWRGRNYPDLYDVKVAIERYKLALLNYVVMDAKSSKKAMTCLKLAWMNRIIEDTNTEELFLKQALDGFYDAYSNEDFPMYGLDTHSVMYLLGELNRRLRNNDEALKWFSSVITSVGVPPRIKELAKDQKDAIYEEKLNFVSSTKETALDDENKDKTKKSSLFSKFFK